jgi:hypothetical protein
MRSIIDNFDSGGGALSQNEEREIFAEHQISESSTHPNLLELKGEVYFVTAEQKFLYELGVALLFSGLGVILVGEYFFAKKK